MKPRLAMLLALSLFALATIGAEGCGESSKSGASASTSKTAAAEAPDTGRMSSGEYEELNSVTERYRGEVGQFGNQLGGKCATLAGVGELAAFSDCVKDAYDGVEDKYTFAQVTYQNLVDATARACRASVKLLDRRIRQLQGTLEAVHEQAENLQLTVASSEVAVRYVTQRRERYLLAYARARKSCRPT